MHLIRDEHGRKASKRRQKSESYHDRISQVRTDSLTPSPENDQIYRPVDPTDPEIVEMAVSMRINGVLEPLIVTTDGYILSGHRRLAGAKLARLETVPVRVLPIRRDDDPEEFVRLLREYNRQRDKTLDEKLREEIVSINPDAAAAELFAYRRAKAAVDAKPLKIRGKTRRAKISKAKLPLLNAIIGILNEQRNYWPLSDRRVHYALLNNPPLIHASKPNSTYRNDHKSYRKVVDVLTRARLDGSIPFAAIADETRPVSLWNIYEDPRSFVRKELRDMFRDYWRNLMQSQPNHIEIIGEKNTVASTIKPVAMEYTIPMTIGRGYASLPPRHAMAERYRKSGKDKLVLLIVSDFDPEGEDIAHSFARSMRDDFGIKSVHAIKAALTSAQVDEHNLPPGLKAKDEGGSRREKYVARHGEYVYELEALAPDVLQRIVREAVESVIDQEAYVAEIKSEREDAAWLHDLRQRVLAAMSGIDLGGDDE